MLLGDASADDAAGALIDNEAVDTLHRAIALGVRIEGASKSGRTRSAMADAQRLHALLQNNETPYLKVLAGRFEALALLSAGQAEQAERLLADTLSYAQTHRAGLEMEPFLMVARAKALVMSHSPQAQAAAAAAAALARSRSMRTAEAGKRSRSFVKLRR